MAGGNVELRHTLYEILKKILVIEMKKIKGTCWHQISITNIIFILFSVP